MRDKDTHKVQILNLLTHIAFSNEEIVNAFACSRRNILKYGCMYLYFHFFIGLKVPRAMNVSLVTAGILGIESYPCGLKKNEISIMKKVKYSI